MGNYFEPVLSEEQMAAYLDGMLSTEESNMVEELIESCPEMKEIQNAIDSVDSLFVFETNEEIPIECLADDFSLPSIDYNDHQTIGSYSSEDDVDNELYNHYDYQDNFIDIECQAEESELGHDDSFLGDGYDDIAF